MRQTCANPEMFSTLEPRLMLSSTLLGMMNDPQPSFSVLHTVTRPMLGDVNGDGVIDADDLATLISNWGLAGPEATWERGNISGDDRVDSHDLGLLLSNWGKSAVQPASPEPVDPTPVDPEPVDPTPVDPEPADPTPVDPEPEPEPLPEPEPVVPPPSGDPLAGWSVGVNSGTLLIIGTDGDDSFTLSQQGSTFIMTVMGQQYTFTGVSRVVAYMGDGDDTVTLDSSVTVPAWLYGEGGNDTITGGSGGNYIHGGSGNNRLYGGSGDDTFVTVGGGLDTVSGGGGTNRYWADAHDTIHASTIEIAGGYVNRIASFYQPYSSDPSHPDYVPLMLDGQDLRDPQPISSSHVYANYAHKPLFSNGPDLFDIIQGNVGNCYFLAALGSLAMTNPEVIEGAVGDLGDGTYVVRFFEEYTRQPVYIRLDGDLPSRFGRPVYAQLTPDGELWVALMEKAYAYFRYGTNSYASLDGGWMSSVYHALVQTYTSSSAWFTLSSSAAAVYKVVNDRLSQGYTVSVGSRSTATGPIVASHAYVVVSADIDSQGTRWITVYNTWGQDGRSYDSNPNDGLLRIAAADFGTYFSAVSAIKVA